MVSTKTEQEIPYELREYGVVVRNPSSNPIFLPVLTKQQVVISNRRGKTREDVVERLPGGVNTRCRNMWSSGKAQNSDMVAQ